MLMKSYDLLPIGQGAARLSLRRTARLVIGDHPRVAPLKRLDISDRPLATAWLPQTAGTLDDHFEAGSSPSRSRPSDVPEGLVSVADLGQGSTEWLDPPPDDPALDAEGGPADGAGAADETLRTP